MSSSSRRSNNDHSAPRGSGRSPNSVRRTSSQPPQPFQPPVTVSGTHNNTAGGIPWTNRPPSNLQGTAPGQAQHLYPNPSGDDWDYSHLTSQLTGSAQLQPTSSHQLQIAVPELYPSTSTPTSSGQYVNPQSGDRGRRYQHSTAWSGDTHDLSLSHTSLQPLSPLPQPQTTSVSPNVLYATPSQYPQTPNRRPQDYPPQRRQQQQQQQQPSPPRPQNNVPSLSQPQVSSNTSQGAPLYATQYNSLPSSSQQYTGTHPSNYNAGRPPVAQPPPNQNRRDASIRPTGPGEGGAIPNDWGYRRGGPDTLSVSATLRTVPQTTPQNAPQTAPRPAPLGAPQPVVNIRQRSRPSQPAATAPRLPICLIPGCHRPVVEDLRTNELTEYCGEGHMIDALQTHGVLVCPACNRFPRRRGREYCGTSCEQWAAQRRQQQQQQQPQQQRQGQQQSSAVNPYPLVPNPNSGSVTWSNAAVGPTSSSSVSSPRVRQGQFHW